MSVLRRVFSHYCDVCGSLERLQNEDKVKDGDSLLNQLRGVDCPDKPGVYTFRKRFCFNDWSAFDEDGDCQLDFLQNKNEPPARGRDAAAAKRSAADYREALRSLQQIGYVRFQRNLRVPNTYAL